MNDRCESGDPFNINGARMDSVKGGRSNDITDLDRGEITGLWHGYVVPFSHDVVGRYNAGRHEGCSHRMKGHHQDLGILLPDRPILRVGGRGICPRAPIGLLVRWRGGYILKINLFMAVLLQCVRAGHVSAHGYFFCHGCREEYAGRRSRRRGMGGKRD